MTKRIVLCADDYGQAEAVSKGILDLLERDRLTATSCMVNMPGWLEQSRWLEPLHQQVDIGLHLNFTEGKPLSALYRKYVDDEFMPLSRLLWNTVVTSKRIRHDVVKAEIEAQLEAFQQAMGFMPRFIDGHQHVHHLPLISDVLVEVYRQSLKEHGVYVRAVTQNLSDIDLLVKGLKKAIIHLTGGGRFDSQLDLNGIPHNSSFAGIYPFKKAHNYRKFFLEFLEESVDRGLIMCHPGLESSDKTDPIHRSRFLEYQYFASAEFLKDCQRNDVTLTRFLPEYEQA